MTHHTFNYKQVISLIILFIGLGGVAYAVHSGNKLTTARGRVRRASVLLPGPSSKVFSGIAHRKMTQYDSQITWLWIGSVALIAIGSSGLYIFRTKK